MKVLYKLARIAPTALLAIAVGVPLYALPATLSLPRGQQSTVGKLTRPQAARQLRESGKTGWALVEAARALVAQRMQYCRRNSFDSAAKAFERGYGYCVQHAYALVHLLTQLGFEAQVVHAFRNRFPDGNVTSHAWVSVTADGETRYVDSLFYDAQAGQITFTPLSEVLGISPTFKALTWWGATAVNAHRFYLTGKDEQT
jgi:transglutaminase-like putative cysteine protease